MAALETVRRLDEACSIETTLSAALADFPLSISLDEPMVNMPVGTAPAQLPVPIPGRA